MIAGTVVIEDHIINYKLNPDENTITYSVVDSLNSETETLTVNSKDFMNALCIALHPDALSDVIDDDMQASAEKALGDLRWMP